MNEELSHYHHLSWDTGRYCKPVRTVGLFLKHDEKFSRLHSIRIWKNLERNKLEIIDVDTQATYKKCRQKISRSQHPITLQFSKQKL